MRPCPECGRIGTMHAAGCPMAPIRCACGGSFWRGGWDEHVEVEQHRAYEAKIGYKIAEPRSLGR